MDIKGNESAMERRIGFGGAAIPVPITRAYSSQLANRFNWEQVLRILEKNRLFVFGVAALISVLVGAYAFHLKDVYAPSAKLEIDPPGSGALSPRDQESGVDYNNEYLETQSQILQDDELATLVIRHLHLDRNVEMVGAKNLERYGVLTNGVQPADTREGLNSVSMQGQFNAAQRTPLEKVALRAFHNRLTVGVVRGSRLVEVSFASSDPRMAQEVTNSLVGQFIDQNFRTRYGTTMQASEWLSAQLSDLRHNVEESNQAVVDYQKRYGLVEEDEKEGPTSQLVSGVSHHLAEAQAERIQAEAYVRMIDAGQAESLPQVQQSQVYQTLTSRYAESSASLAQARAIYGEENNNFKKLQNERNELATQRDAEKERIVSQVYTAYAAATEREQLMSASMARLKLQMGDVNERMVRYRMLRDESRANAELYNALLGRLKEAGLYAGLKSSNIRLVDPASVLDRPTSPHRALIVATGTLLGGILAVVLAFARESLNNTIRTPDDILDSTGLPSLAMVPAFSLPRQELPGTFKPALSGWNGDGRAASPLPLLLSTGHYTREGEAFRELRTSIMFSSAAHPPQALLVASPAAGEGKSLIAINLAIALSQYAKTCLMDCDLRGPVISNAFGYLSMYGWAGVLLGSVKPEAALIQVKEFGNLSLLPVGSHAPDINSGEWIGSEQMKKLIDDLRSRFTFIVIDSPPMIPFADARVLSLLTDGVVLVGRYGLTTRRALTRCAQTLQDIGASVLGVVLNAMDFSSPDYHYYNFGRSSAKLQDYYPSGERTELHSRADEKQKSRAAGA